MVLMRPLPRGPFLAWGMRAAARRLLPRNGSVLAVRAPQASCKPSTKHAGPCRSARACLNRERVCRAASRYDRVRSRVLGRALMLMRNASARPAETGTVWSSCFVRVLMVTTSHHMV
jgi:hypothetical protein